MSNTESYENGLEESRECPDCGNIFAESDLDTDDHVYECSSCGSTFRRSETDNYNHVCPYCFKFSSRIGDVGCPDCGGVLEDPELRTRCPDCNEWFDDEEEYDCHRLTTH